MFNIFKKKKTDFEKIGDYIDSQLDYRIEREFGAIFGKELAEIKNLSYKLKSDSDFMHLTVIELLQFMQQTEKDKKRLKVYDSAINQVKERINIMTKEQEIRFRKEGLK